jgi:hypothetical protein
MQTYQKYLEAVEQGRLLEFLVSAIGVYQASDVWRNAKLGDDYMRQQNTTISKYRKWLRDNVGRIIEDDTSPNYKCANAYYKQNVIQLVQYLCSNGVTFTDENTKDALGGSAFDNKLSRIVRYAAAEGVAYGFYNNGTVEWFRALEFIPLFDEETGRLRAGIRFWRLSAKHPLRITLFTEDGFQDFIRREDADLEPMGEMQPYKLNLTYVQGYDETAIAEGENYPELPIVPCYANYERQAEIVGKQEHIDCYDLIESGFCDDIDQATFVYWILNNAGGMDDIDLAEFRRRVHETHVVKTDDDSTATAQTLDIPSSAREALLVRLEQDIYNDAMALNPRDIASGNVTATAINAAYQRLDNRADELEYCVIEFVQGLLRLVGIDDTPKFKRNKLTNMEEETAMVLSAATVLDHQTILEHLPFITPEEIPIILDRTAEQQMSMLDDAQEGGDSVVNQ